MGGTYRDSYYEIDGLGESDYVTAPASDASHAISSSLSLSARRDSRMEPEKKRISRGSWKLRIVSSKSLSTLANSLGCDEGGEVAEVAKAPGWKGMWSMLANPSGYEEGGDVAEVSDVEVWNRSVQTCFGENMLHPSELLAKGEEGSDSPRDLWQPSDFAKLFHVRLSKSSLETQDMELGRSRMDDGPARKRIRSPNWCDEETRSLLELGRSQMARSHDGPATKRIRSPNWSDEETRSLLELRLEAARVGKRTHIWDCISGNLYRQKGFDRAWKSCLNRWDTLLKFFNAIDKHESKIKSGTSICVSYWEMDRDERSKNKLPQAFSLEWYEIMEKILTAMSENEKTDTSSDLPLGQSHLDAGNLDSADCRKVLLDEPEVEDVDTDSEDEEVSCDSTTTIESSAGV